MKTSMFHVLRVGHLLFEGIETDPQVSEHLVQKGLTLAWLSQGRQMVERADGLRARRDAARGAVKGTTDTIRGLHRALATEMADLRFAAWRAFHTRPDLAVSIGVARRRREKPEETVAPAPVGGTTMAPSKPKRAVRNLSTVAFVQSSRGLLQALLDAPDAMALLEAYGYGRDGISALLARVEALARTEVEHEGMKAALESATAALHDSTEAFRRWFYPWRKRLLTALKDRPDLRRLVQQAA